MSAVEAEALDILLGRVEEGSYSGWKHAKAAAEAKGCVVVTPRCDELFVDIDREEDLRVFEKNWPRVLERYPGSTYVRRPSPSGVPGRYHVVCTLSCDVDSALERILLQAVLGSDRLRELLSYVRWLDDVDEPTLFFERPGVHVDRRSTPPLPPDSSQPLPPDLFADPFGEGAQE